VGFYSFLIPLMVTVMMGNSVVDVGGGGFKSSVVSLSVCIKKMKLRERERELYY